MRRTDARRHQYLALLIVVGLSLSTLSACSGDSSHKAASSTTEGIGERVGKPERATADRTGAIDIDIPGVAHFSGGPGTLVKGTAVVAAPVKVAVPSSAVDEATLSVMGTGVDVEIPFGKLRKPLTVTFPNATAPTGASLVAVHVSDDGRYSLLPATEPDTGGLVVVTDRFSIISWAQAQLLKPVGDFFAQKLAGRTDPPQCSDAPQWASVTPSASGSTHACVRAGKPLADGTEIAELEIKSNRGNYQWVELPSNLPREYVWVEEQNDFVRAMIRGVFGRSDAVLLPSGARMTVGYRQPDLPTQLQFRTSVDTAAGVLTVGRLALDAVTDDAMDKTGSYIALLTCFGALHVDLANLDSPAQLQNPDVLTSMFSCVIDTMRDFYKNPSIATSAAGSLLGSETSDVTLTNLSQDLFKFGRFANLIAKVVGLGSYVLKELAFVTDAIVGEFGAPNASIVTFSLNAKAPPPESFYQTFGVHGGGATFNADGSGRAYGHNGFTRDNRWVNQVETFTTTLSPDQRTLTITIREVHWEANGEPIPNPYPQYPVGIAAGDTLIARFEHPHLLKVTALNAQDPQASLGNPYLCGSGLDPAYQDLCGA